MEKEVKNEKEQKYDMIVTIVNRGFSDYVIESAQRAGASGSTIILARGTGVRENEELLGIKIHPEKEIVLTIVPREVRNNIMKGICNDANLNLEGKGLCFSFPVNNLLGVSHNFKPDKKK